jgi:AraC-like DNA-binding protein
MDAIDHLAAAITRHAPQPGMAATAVPRLQLIRADRPTERMPSVYEASLCLIAQGAKQVALGDQVLHYDPTTFLVVSVDLPLVGHVTHASPDAPYLCCKIDLNLSALAEMVIAEGGAPRQAELPALAVYPAETELVDAACRLVRLLDQPAAIPALAPLIEREILFRLLSGPHGATLRYLASGDSRLGQVSRAIAQIRRRYHEQIRIEEIAATAGMSPSSLHAHFKAVTRMTPLEYQKQLRLQEARRLMLAEGRTAGSAGFAVGYDSPSQFSREYHRLFGAPPRRDIERLQGAPVYAFAT